MVQEQKIRTAIAEFLWGKIDFYNLPKVDNQKVEKLLKGGYLFGFTASDFLIILSAILTLFFLQIQPYLIPYLEGRLDLSTFKIIENKFIEEQASEKSLDAISKIDTPTTNPTVPGEPSVTPQSTGTAAGPVSVRIESVNLVITNNTDDLIGFEAIPEETLSVIEWGPCDSPERCRDQVLEPGETRRINLNRLVGRDTSVLVFFWWPLLEKSDGNGYLVSDLYDVRLDVTDK